MKGKKKEEEEIQSLKFNLQSIKLSVVFTLGPSHQGKVDEAGQASSQLTW
jgi:hypothetical protein